ncbi:hypothetical protein HK096_009499 [Nowakowskiella sp. JEL0078]|nr:hypothetical protein HK096_009499 [Nowakowskiella sp. JEL0078]
MAEKRERKRVKDSDDDEEEEAIRREKPKNITDIQRIRLSKLMSNPEKEVKLPEIIEPVLAPPKDFVRNVQGIISI